MAVPWPRRLGPRPRWLRWPLVGYIVLAIGTGLALYGVNQNTRRNHDLAVRIQKERTAATVRNCREGNDRHRRLLVYLNGLVNMPGQQAQQRGVRRRTEEARGGIRASDRAEA